MFQNLFVLVQRPELKKKSTMNKGRKIERKKGFRKGDIKKKRTEKEKE